MRPPLRRLLALVLTTTLAVPATLLATSAAAPAQAATNTGSPHYFGPWPNWANSALTTSNATVTIQGAGTGATAKAKVDPLTGGLVQIDILTPGAGYDPATTSVVLAGGDPAHPATAQATVATTGTVTGATVAAAGSGYSGFRVTLAGGGGTGAVLTADGGVDAVVIDDGGSGYTMPTVEFALPDLETGTQAKGHVATVEADGEAGMTPDGQITRIVVDEPGSGYLTAPAVAVHNGTLFEPLPPNGEGRSAQPHTTLKLTGLTVTSFGSGYTSAPTVTITDVVGGAGSGAAATASTDVGAVTAITVTDPGAGYLDVGIRKFVDELPLPCNPAAGGCPTDAAARYLPIAVPTVKTYNGQEADEYTIALVQYRRQFSADLPPTLVRGYVQVDTGGVPGSQRVPLVNELLDGTKVDTGLMGVTTPQWLGPFINATKDRPVRIVFRNLLPTGANGDLFLPTDSTMMGAGMVPMTMTPPADEGTVTDGVRNQECSQSPKPAACFKDNRATLHLHGGITPWISDGTPHQWITPAGEDTPWPQGVSVQNVPDMGDAGCQAADDGCQTFYYTNQQSARLMFYHDHSWGITRLNVYAGEAAGYAITDPTEKRLVDGGLLPGAADTLPLIVQDRTFVPGEAQIHDTLNPDGSIATYGQDPTWDTARWGGEGNLWYHHVYMPAQNPGDPGGMSAYGRWMYGPWFYPPAADTTYGPIANPSYDPACKLDDPATWQYQTDPYCEPQQIPGTPNVSAGMEQFNDTPLVNGVAYPTLTVQPKSYRLRLLNAANDRFFNLQWYVADPDQGNGKTEVKLDPDQLAAAQLDPTVSPTPVHNSSTAGPDWIQFANEGGFLPTPTVVDGQQHITWIQDPTRFDVGNVDAHALLIAPAERADTVVDFSKFAGKTLILYNDAPAAFPARVPQYDYYTGAPDLSPAGAPEILPGYGPNTRTIMQVTVADAPAAAPFDLTKLTSAFRHTVNGTGVFESGQHPIIVGQAAYNSAYGTSFASGANCNVPGAPRQTCDGLVRISDTGEFGFNTLARQSSRQAIKLDLKSVHDEMNATSFDPFGRMSGNLGLEKSPPTPGLANAVLLPYVNAPTELIDGTSLPTGMSATPITTTADGTQIWRITHNGVDTHPIHFHLFDVQVLNRVTWDNIIIRNDPNENGWKDTVRVSPLEDTIVALRPITPVLPWEIPNSVRPMNPMMPLGDTSMFNSVDTQGDPLGTPMTNKLVNYGWEYVWHCHILSHEEMDMMRPMSYVLPPRKPDQVTRTVVGSGSAARNAFTFRDNSIAETSYDLERSADGGTTWAVVATSASPLDQVNTAGGVRTLTDPGSNAGDRASYRVTARNTAGYAGVRQMTASASSDVVTLTGQPPAAATNLTATLAAGPRVNLAWQGNASATGVLVERSVDGTTWTTVATLTTPATTWSDATVQLGATYSYRVRLTNAVGASEPSNVVSVRVSAPAAPTGVSANADRDPRGRVIAVRWTDNATNEADQLIEWSSRSGGPAAGSLTVPANATTATTGPVHRSIAFVRVGSRNALGTSWSGWVRVR